VTQPRPGHFLLTGAGENWFWQPEAHVPVMSVQPVPADCALRLNHPAIFVQPNTRFCRRAYAGVVAEESPAVEPAHPPAAMLRVSNPVVRLLLRTPAGGPMRRQFMVLRFTGRKTGRRYDLPVVAHRQGGELYALTDARWRHNFRGGADAEVTLDGHVTSMRGHLLDDPEIVAPIYARSIGQFGVKRAQRMLGLKIHPPGTPTAEALAEAARRYHLSAIRFTTRT